MEVRPEDEKDQPGFYLDPLTAAECSEFLARTLEMEAEFQEHATGIITLPFDRDTLKDVTDAMYTRVLRVVNPWLALSYLRVASYLQSPGLRDTLINGYFDKHLFGEGCLEPYHALRRWVMARCILKELNPDEAEVYQPFVRFEARTRAYVLQHFDAAVTSFLADTSQDLQPGLSDLDTLLLDPTLQCCNEDNVFRLLKDATEYSGDPEIPSLSELCRRYLRPELMHPTVLLHLIRTSTFDKRLEPWLYDCLKRANSRTFNTVSGCPPVQSGRKSPPKLPYKVEVTIEGMELLAEVEDRRKRDKEFKCLMQCGLGVPFQGACSSLSFEITSKDNQGVQFGYYFRAEHYLNPSVRGITRYSAKLDCAYSSDTRIPSCWNCKFPEDADDFFKWPSWGPFFAVDRIPALPGPNAPPLPPTSLKLTLTFEEFAEVHETLEQLVLRPEPPVEPIEDKEEEESEEEEEDHEEPQDAEAGQGKDAAAQPGPAPSSPRRLRPRKFKGEDPDPQQESDEAEGGAGPGADESGQRGTKRKR